MKYLIGIILFFLSSAFAQDCQSAVKDILGEDYHPSMEELEKAVKKYTYNAKKMKCVSYFEVDPNVRANSFESKEECRGNCSIEYGIDCNSTKDSGPCREAHKHFYYNTASSTCEEFTYGGCQGNANNYWSLNSCVYFCVPQPDDCQSAVTDMAKKEDQKVIERYTYDAAQMKCVLYFEGDPEVRANSFLSWIDCAKHCSPKLDRNCTSPKDSGPCRKTHKRFYYNTASSTCEEFAYGGCQGNSNNYESLLDCENSCAPLLDEECTSPKDSGPCCKTRKSFYYNTTSSSCEEFEYGGCRGNGNNYMDLENCEDACVPRPNDCNHPKDSGPCLASDTRYFYNTASLKCEEFKYGGCDGNANKFRNLALCQKSCEK